MWTIYKTFFEFVIQLHGSSVGKESACSAEDPGLIPGSGRPPGEGNGSYSSIPAWKILWTEELGGLQSMGSQGSNTTQRLNHVCSHTSFFLFFNVCFPFSLFQSLSLCELQSFYLCIYIYVYLFNSHTVGETKAIQIMLLL